MSLADFIHLVLQFGQPLRRMGFGIDFLNDSFGFFFLSIFTDIDFIILQ